MENEVCLRPGQPSERGYCCNQLVELVLYSALGLVLAIDFSLELLEWNCKRALDRYGTNWLTLSRPHVRRGRLCTLSEQLDGCLDTVRKKKKDPSLVYLDLFCTTISTGEMLTICTLAVPPLRRSCMSSGPTIAVIRLPIGAHYDGLLAVKNKWSPDSVFYAYKGVDSDAWTIEADGRMRRT